MNSIAAELLNPLPASGRFETRAYGMAVKELLDGDRDRAMFLLRRVAEDSYWPGFGRIAAEADLVRMAAGIGRGVRRLRRCTQIGRCRGLRRPER